MAVSTSDFPSRSTVQGEPLEPVDDDGNVVVDNLTTLDPGETAYISILAYENADGSGSESDNLSKARASHTNTVHPEVDAQTSQSGSTGTLDLTVYDEQLRVTAVEFKKKTGADDFDASWSTAWDSSPDTPGTDETLTYSEDVGLKRKHNVAIKWRVTFTDADSASQTIANTHEFDIDEIPEITHLMGDYALDESAGQYVARSSGVADEDTETVYVTASFGGTAVTPDAGNAFDTIDVSSDKTWERREIVGGCPDNEVQIKARGEDVDGNLAPLDAIASDTFPIPASHLSISSVGMSVADDGTDDIYNVEWSPSEGMTDACTTLEVYLYDGSTQVHSETVNDPNSTTSLSHTETGAGGDPGSSHKVILLLIGPDGVTTVGRAESSVVSADTSGGGSSPPVEPV